uniref:H15 domain-containing protein n=1 Tax=Ditylenchus dipsaci TaxID=166011 RepID=A0A915D5I6_9BILA
MARAQNFPATHLVASAGLHARSLVLKTSSGVARLPTTTTTLLCCVRKDRQRENLFSLFLKPFAMVTTPAKSKKTSRRSKRTKMSAENGATASQTNGTAPGAAEPTSAIATEAPVGKRVTAKPAATSAAATSKPKKVVKSAVTAPGAHSTYIEMIKVAITELKEKTGSSRAAILKHITQHNQVGDNGKMVNAHLRQALIRGVSTGALNKPRGTASTAAKPKTSPKKSVKSAKKVAAKPATTSITTTASAPTVVKPKKLLSKSSCCCYQNHSSIQEDITYQK